MGLLRLLFGSKRKPRGAAPAGDFDDSGKHSSEVDVDTDQSADWDASNGDATPFDRSQNPVKARKQSDSASFDDIVVVDTDDDKPRKKKRRYPDRELYFVAAIVTTLVGITLPLAIANATPPDFNTQIYALALYIFGVGALGVLFTRTSAGWFSWFWAWLFALVVWWYFLGWNQILPQKDKTGCGWWRQWVLTQHLHEKCDGKDGVGPDLEGVIGSPILAEQSTLGDWVEPTFRDFVLENKFRALDINYSAKGGSNLNTGNNLLGLYDREVMKRPVEAGVHFLLAGSNGDYDARELYQDLSLSDAQQERAQTSFEGIHKLNGGEGYFRLGQMYLADEALNLATNPYYALYPSREPPYRFHYPDFSVDFLGDVPDHSRAYINMHIAVLCGVTKAIDWRRYIEELGNISTRREALRRQASEELEIASKNTDGGFEAYCAGENLQKRIELLVDPAIIWRFLADRRPWPTYGELVQKLNLPEYEFREWIGLLVTESIDLYGYQESEYYRSRSQGSLRPYPYGSQGSEYYRNSPGADSTRRPGSNGGSGGRSSGGAVSGAGRGGVQTRARDGLPAECVGLAPGEECPSRFDELACRNNATAILNLGKAYMAAGNVREARRNLQLANDEGRKCQAEAARQAARLLQALNLTCEYNEASLARVSRDALNNPEGGAIIALHARQSALQAHGHYDYKVDGKYGPKTRDAIRLFQADYGFDQTGDLTPIETVYLICSAAEIKSQAISMNTLGMMYLAGLGVVQNTDAGLDWLKKAEARGDMLAKYNLALVYGAGTVGSSYKLCGVPENLQIADSYLTEAADLGHPGAKRLIRDYGADLVSDRWRKIKKWVEGDEFHQQRMSAVGEGCRPNP